MTVVWELCKVREFQRILLYLFCITFSLSCVSLAATQSQTQTAVPRDGSHDFDFTFGTWKSHISRLQHPLTGSKTWIQMEGIKVARKVWDGRAAIEEVEAETPAGQWQSLALFLYNKESRQWSINFANSADGTFSKPATGEFKNGRGEFYDQEDFKGRAILVRIIWSDITPNSHRFEQAFSDDGGKTWETNFIAVLKRTDEVKPVSESASANPGQHDFDWEIGSWKLHVKRMPHPLSDEKNWVELNGTVAAQKIWGGRANIAEIALNGPSGHLDFLSLRLYNPQTHEWNMNFATSGAGNLSVPMFGGFKDGHGEFYDQEMLNGKSILVRFVFTGLARDAGHSEQAFSKDGGKTWEVNWINDYSRTTEEAKR
jgi:hypothetical protein